MKIYTIYFFKTSPFIYSNFFCSDLQLLSSEGLDCAYIYSALDQTARKINIGKFVHRKAMVLIVTDVAARGIDIPMLDNVINYNFPSKAKLFLHRVGEQLIDILPSFNKWESDEIIS